MSVATGTHVAEVGVLHGCVGSYEALAAGAGGVCGGGGWLGSHRLGGSLSTERVVCAKLILP